MPHRRAAKHNNQIIKIPLDLLLINKNHIENINKIALYSGASPRYERSVAPDHHLEETRTMADRNSTTPRQATSQTTELDARIAALTQELMAAHEQIARLEAAAAQARLQLPPNKTVTELRKQIKQLYAELPHLCPDEDRQ